MNSQAATSEPKTVIDILTSELHGALRRVENAAEELEGRLGHVIHPAMKPSEAISNTIVSTVPLTDGTQPIQAATDRADTLAQRLRDLTSRIGV